jgi:hypothetical protein
MANTRLARDVDFARISLTTHHMSLTTHHMRYVASLYAKQAYLIRKLATSYAIYRE